MYYYQLELDGECVSRVYKIEAESWEEAKKNAWGYMKKGDVLAECDEDAIIERCGGDYCYIDEDMAKKYAVLQCGVWTDFPDSSDGFNMGIWYWSDAEDEYLDVYGDPWKP